MYAHTPPAVNSAVTFDSQKTRLDSSKFRRDANCSSQNTNDLCRLGSLIAAAIADFPNQSPL
jgi:hypothetical protein